MTYSEIQLKNHLKVFNDSLDLININEQNKVVIVECKKHKIQKELSYENYMKSSIKQSISWCKECAKNDYKIKLFNVHSDKFNIIGDYLGYDVKTLFKCNICGNNFEATPHRMVKDKNRVGCIHCYGKNRNLTRQVTLEIFQERLKKKFPKGEFKYISGYINFSTECTFKCKNCKSKFSIRPDYLLDYSDTKCPNCKTNKSYTTEEFRKIVEKTDSDYEFIGPYINNKTKTKFFHKVCGKEVMIRPENFLYSGDRCPECYKYKAWTYEKFLNKFNKIPGSEEFEIVSEYHSTHNPISIRHKKCGNVITYSDCRLIFNHLNCKECYTYSSPEFIIAKYLERNNIEFIYQKTFTSCKNQNLLPFDFYIPSYLLLLEYDGKQHFEPIMGKDSFYITMINDDIKNNWIRNHSEYSLIRINYKQDLLSILDDIFVKNEISEDVFSINI